MAHVTCRMCGADCLEFAEPQGVLMCDPCQQRFANDFAEYKSGRCAAEGGHDARRVFPVPKYGVQLCERHFRQTMVIAVWPEGWP